MNQILKIFPILAIALCACAEKHDHSLKNIIERNELTVLIRANSSDYFIFRGFPKGFQLELTQHFADYLGVNLRIVSTTESEEPLRFILDEHIDIIASNITIVETGKDLFCFTPFEAERTVAWGMRCCADSLATVVNFWVDSIAKTKTFANLCLKYHIQPRRGYLQSDSTSLEFGHLSPYDDAIKKYAERLNWDWRLLAALIYQESNFYPEVISWKGAIGLMQLMPDVAEKYDITLESPPEAHILAGVRHLQEIDKLLPDEIPEEERTAFILAAYNVGPGHIFDARRLALKYEKDPNVWFDNVDVELLKKSDRTILRDTIIRHGYARGEETYNFVREIFERWGHYRNLVK
ncbi:MAG: transglycosylase SLT domain-containing protein [Bacteroidales bacterium]|nr:transglycosylase SLT domain-containing protein [Bacteroidales bacterium]